MNIYERRLTQQEEHLENLGRQRTKLAALLLDNSKINGGLLASVMSGDYEKLRCKFLRSTEKIRGEEIQERRTNKSLKVVVWTVIFVGRLRKCRASDESPSASAVAEPVFSPPPHPTRRQSREKGEMQAKALALKHPPKLHSAAVQQKNEKTPAEIAKILKLQKEELHRTRRENYLRMMRERDDEMKRKNERIRAEIDRVFLKPLRIVFDTIRAVVLAAPKKLHPVIRKPADAKFDNVRLATDRQAPSQQKHLHDAAASKYRGKKIPVGFSSAAKPTPNVLLEPISSPSKM